MRLLFVAILFAGAVTNGETSFFHFQGRIRPNVHHEDILLLEKRYRTQAGNH